MKLDNVVFELDAKLVVDNFNKFYFNLSYFGFIIRDFISSLNELRLN